MQETLYQTADAEVSPSDSDAGVTADAGVSLSDSGCRRQYTRADALSIRQRMQETLYQESLYQTADASDSGCRRH